MSEAHHDISDHDASIDGEALDLAQIARSEAPGLLRFLRRQRVELEDAQDLAQEAMLRFVRVAPSTRIATPGAYLRQIASNLLRNHLQHSSSKLAAVSVPLIEGLDVEDQTDQHHALATREELAHWQQILSELKPRTLEIFLLSRVDRFTYREIADRFGMTIWNVERHVRKAIAHIDRNRGDA